MINEKGILKHGMWTVGDKRNTVIPTQPREVQAFSQLRAAMVSDLTSLHVKNKDRLGLRGGNGRQPRAGVVNAAFRG